jgi:hypothetical protein
MVTLAVAVAVLPPGKYWTVMVQLLPALRVDPQVLPVIEKLPPVVPTLLTTDAAVKVNAPAVAPVAVLLTVMLPVRVAVPLAPPVVNAGAGADMVMVAPVTVKFTLAGELAPFAVSVIDTA